MIESEPLELDRIIYGDCKDVLLRGKDRFEKYLQRKGIALPDQFVDLVYMDPPFFSGRNYDEIWHDGGEIRSFNDSHWYEDGKRRNSINAYLEFMRIRIEACYDVLKPTGSFYLHCDWHASHYLKKMCDEIFGVKNFKDAIVWGYSGRENPKQRMFPRKHDDILYYVKSKDYTFNTQYKPYRLEYIEQFFKHNDDDGKGQYQLQPDGKGGRYKQYLNKSKGHPINDVWTDIRPLNNRGSQHERLGYPTQKPEALLERIIKTSSNPGEIVLDPFCGCGSTAIASRKLNRHFIGIDASYTACKVMQDRLIKRGFDNIQIVNRPYNGKESRILNPIDFQNTVITQLGNGAKPNPKKGGDKGIDGWDGNQNPVQVKQSDHVGRQVIDQFSSAIRRYFLQEGKKNKERQGIIICYSLTSGAWEEIKRLKHEENIDINAITIGNNDSIDRIKERWDRINKKRGVQLD